jgi:glycosyltransferase involved in cell wall biosynthesis
VPLRIAQGIQNKILEALAVGLPVITTPVAAGELGSVKDLPLAVASDADSFAEAVIRAIDSYPPSPEAVHACRNHLDTNYNWTTNLATLETLVEQAIAQKHSREG